MVAGLEDWSVAVELLIEVMLSADGRYACLRKTSNPKASVVVMYCFVLATSVMLVNMLIALMAKVGRLAHLVSEVARVSAPNDCPCLGCADIRQCIRAGRSPVPLPEG